MRSHAIVFALVVAILSITVCFPPLTNSNQLPVIKLCSIHGYSAEISNYHFDAQQNFCFTLTNTSSLPINALGADLGGRAFISIFSQTDNGASQNFIAEVNIQEHTLNGIQMSFVLFALGGLRPGNSTTICLTGLGGSSAENVAHNIFVTFSPAVSLGCTDPNSQTEDVLVQFTRSTDTEQCLIISNPSTEVVTGVGLDLTDLTDSFRLTVINPSPQPFKQHLRFAKNPGSVDNLGNIPLNFALLSGGQFSHGGSKNGVGPGEISSEFCIAGNFQGLTPEEVIRRTYVRVADSTRTCFNNCCPVGKGQTGVLAGEPR